MGTRYGALYRSFCRIRQINLNCEPSRSGSASRTLREASDHDCAFYGPHQYGPRIMSDWAVMPGGRRSRPMSGMCQLTFPPQSCRAWNETTPTMLGSADSCRD
jgi:hypothetical protein